MEPGDRLATLGREVLGADVSLDSHHELGLASEKRPGVSLEPYGLSGHCRSARG
jgi:hypothetical protein